MRSTYLLENEFENCRYWKLHVMGDRKQCRPELLIREGDTVIIDINGGKQVFVTMRPKSKVKLGNSHVLVEPLIGCPYGTLFSLSSDSKELIQSKHVPSEEWISAPEIDKNNSNLVDRGAENQQLSKADIEAMRKAGKSGDEIVAALTASSATYASKTEFSQEKYKKRKAKKYIFTVCARRPTAAAVCQAYYSKQPSKIGYLRIDTLSLLLSLANVGAHAQVLVIDTCGGMVTAAAAERLGGFGSVTAVYIGAKHPGSEALQQFNFKSSVQATISTVALKELAAGLTSIEQNTPCAVQLAGAMPDSSNQVAGTTGKEVSNMPGLENGREEIEGMQIDGTFQAAEDCTGTAALSEHPSPNPKQSAQPVFDSACRAEGVGNADVYRTDNISGTASPRCASFNSCIIAAPGLSPLPALHAVLPMLAPSTPFVIYGHWAQPLAEAMAELQLSRQALGLSLQESWWRDHQVLPSRTHPTMQMNHSGGYLLSGTAIIANQGEQRRPDSSSRGNATRGRGSLARRKRKA